MGRISTEYVPPRKGKPASAVALPPLPGAERRRLAVLLRQLIECAERAPADPMMLTEDAHPGWARRFAELVKENVRMVQEYEALADTFDVRERLDYHRKRLAEVEHAQSVHLLFADWHRNHSPRCPACAHPRPVAACFRQFPADRTILAEKVYPCRFCPPAGG